MTSISLQNPNNDAYQKFADRFAAETFLQGVKRFYFFAEKIKVPELYKILAPFLITLGIRPLGGLINVLVLGKRNFYAEAGTATLIASVVSSIISGIVSYKAYYKWVDGLYDNLWQQLFNEHNDLLIPFRDGLSYQITKDPVYIKGFPNIKYDREPLLHCVKNSKDGKDPLHLTIVTEDVLIPDVCTFRSLSLTIYALILQDLVAARDNELRKKGLKILFLDLQKRIENFLEKCSDFDERLSRKEITQAEVDEWNAFKKEWSQINYYLNPVTS